MFERYAEPGGRGRAAVGRSDYEDLLADLYERQLRVCYDEYLHLHSSNRAVIGRHADAFRRYQRYILPGKVLDWGCWHGVDGCLVGEALGGDVEVYGCDMLDEPFEVFAAHSGLVFTRLEHPFLLPYASGCFDTVIGSGVLEHVERPEESLLEVRRVLRSDGHFVVTFLPNLFS